MFSHISSALIVLALGLVASTTAQPMINSPTTLTQCQPTQISWSGATPPVYVSAVEGTSTASTPLLTFTPQNMAEGSFTWEKVNITAGTTITLIINDQTGVVNFSGQVTIKPGANDCNASIGSGVPSVVTTPAAGGSTASTQSTSGSVTPPSTPKGSPATPPSHPVTPNNTTSSPSTKPATTTSNGAINSAALTAACAAVAGVLVATGLF